MWQFNKERKIIAPLLKCNKKVVIINAESMCVYSKSLDSSQASALRMQIKHYFLSHSALWIIDFNVIIRNDKYEKRYFFFCGRQTNVMTILLLKMTSRRLYWFIIALH